MARAVGAKVTSTSRPASVVVSAVAFLTQLSQALGYRLALAAGVAVGLALAEGTGLLLLVPLLSSIGLTVEEGPTSGLAATIGWAFSAVGLQPSLPAVLVVFLAVSVLHGALYRAHLLLNPSLEQQFSTALRTRLYSAIVSARWSFLVGRRSTDLVHATTAEIDRISTAAYQLLTLLSGLAVSAVYVAIALRLSFWLTILVALAGVAMLWTLRGRTRRSADTGAEYTNTNRALFHMASESIAGLKVAKSVGAEARDIAIFNRLARQRADGYLALLRSFAQSKMRLDLSSAVLICVLLLVAVEGLALKGAGLLVLLFVFARIMPRAMALQESAQMFVTGLPAFSSVMQLIDQCEAEAEIVGAGGSSRIGVGHSVRFESVSYRYTADGPLVLDDVSVQIPAGRTTAIVGPSGAGKSTLADLLIGLLRPQSGTIAIDGHPLVEADGGAWRRSIGYVPQDSFLLHDTIRANLAWARPDASEAAMWDALARASAAEFVRSRTEGLDAVVGDRGVRLSGGERQRLALARALLIEPTVLVLDEATSALDSLNERQILAAVDGLKGHVTVVVITHRLSSILDADVIYVLDQGRLVETGTWDALSARGGVFARLKAAQLGSAGQADQVEAEGAAAEAISGRATAIHGQ